MLRLFCFNARTLRFRTQNSKQEVIHIKNVDNYVDNSSFSFIFTQTPLYPAKNPPFYAAANLKLP